MSVVNAPSPLPSLMRKDEKSPTSTTDATLPSSRRERNKVFAKQSRDRKNKYIKQLETKVDFLENKLMKATMELEQYKQLLRVSDITKSKDAQFQSVMDDFKSTNEFFKDKMTQYDKNPENVCKEAWIRILESVGTNIGPMGAVRRKLLKTAFKVIIRHIIPETYGYLFHTMQYEEKASKRDLTYMKKLNRQEALHYSKEKGFTPKDTMFALLKVTSEEQEYLRKTNYKWQGILVKAKEMIKTLLRIRHEMFNMALELDDCAMDIYKCFKPKSIAAFFQIFYKEISTSEVSMFDFYDIKKKKFVWKKDHDNEVYAMTDSEDE